MVLLSEVRGCEMRISHRLEEQVFRVFWANSSVQLVSVSGVEITFTVPVQASGAMAAGLAYIGGRDDDRAGKEKQVRWQATRDVTCEVVALDEFLPAVERLSLIKCDVEGAELFAFRGAERLIERHLPSVICEINPWYLEGFGVRLEELTDFFFAKGYALYHYAADGGRGRLREVEVSELSEDNYTFIHPSRRGRFAALLGG